MVSGRGEGWRIRCQWNQANDRDASMFSNAACEGTTSSDVNVLTRSGWSSAMRCPTLAPLSWPTTWYESKPSESITSTWSWAVVRLQ